MNTYDYVIAGAGSAGCVLANRLTEDGKTSVLLLEAGPEDKSPMIHMPAGVAHLLRTKAFNWQFDTEAEPHMNNRELYWPRGKVLGGSSSINGIVYIRGEASDYDEWVSLGNKGWSFEDCLPYFKKSQGQSGDSSIYSSELHGSDGPLKVSTPELDNELFHTYLKAGQQAGYPLTPDFNGKQQEGFSTYQQTKFNGKRCSTAVAYLKPAKERANLTVIKNARAGKITFEGNKATGIEYHQKENTVNVKANKEVLLCAGAVQSPQILQLSGIGAAEELKQLGINIVKDLPGVGENLQDHLDVGIQYYCEKPVTFARTTRNPFLGIAELFKYIFMKKGILTSNGLEVGAFLKSDPSLTKPDLQFHFIIAFMIDHARDLSAMREHGMMMHSCQLRPESKGSIKLRSTDPMDTPKIFANYLAEEKDKKVQIAGVKMARDIFSQEAFTPYLGEERMPGKEVQSDDEILDYIRKKGETIYHPVGSCKMGSDPMAVVDSDLKVHGIDGLRVIDASVMPTLIGGNTNAPTIMIAEKIADKIKAEA
jgi:choline dehydrogenase